MAYPSDRPARTPHRYRGIIVLVVALLLCLAAAEGATRALLWWNTPLGMVFRDDLIYTYAPFSEVADLRLNDLGCVGDDLGGRSDDEALALLLGGSTSFSQAYVDAVRGRLAERFPDVPFRVISCGKPRYTSHMNRVQLDEILTRTRPDVVALYLGINDNIYNSFPWVEELPRVGYFDWKSPRTSVFGEMVRYHLVDKRLRSTPEFDEASLRSRDIFRRNVVAMIDAAQARDSEVVLSTFAVALPTDDPQLDARIRASEPIMQHFWGRIGPTLLGVTAHNDVMRSLATQRDLPLAPVASQIPHDGRHFSDLCHLTEEGNRRLGRTMADAFPAPRARPSSVAGPHRAVSAKESSRR